MGAYDSGFGAGLIATWLALLLAGVALKHAVHYFTEFSNDIFFKKALVGFVLFLLFLTLAAECAEIYLDVVTDWGNPVAFLGITWPGTVYVPCISVIAFIVDQFLIYRFHALSKNIWITIILSMCNLVSLVAGFVVLQFFGSHLGHTLTPADLGYLGPVTDLWLGSAGFTDVAIAVSLVWVLRGMRASSKGTTNLIRHIVAISIQNGCTTSAVAIGGLIASVVAPAASLVFYIFYFTISPLYLLTLLSNLTLRESVPLSRRWSSSGRSGTSPMPRSTSGASILTVPTTGGYAESTTSDDGKQSQGERSSRPARIELRNLNMSSTV